MAARRRARAIAPHSAAALPPPAPLRPAASSRAPGPVGTAPPPGSAPSRPTAAATPAAPAQPSAPVAAPPQALLAVGPRAHLFQETPTHYALSGVYFHRLGVSGIDTVLSTAGFPPTDPASGTRLVNIAYLLVGSLSHSHRLTYCDPSRGAVRYPPTWFSSKLAKEAVDAARSALGKPAGWLLPPYFR